MSVFKKKTDLIVLLNASLGGSMYITKTKHIRDSSRYKGVVMEDVKGVLLEIVKNDVFGSMLLTKEDLDEVIIALIEQRLELEND